MGINYHLKENNMTVKQILKITWVAFVSVFLVFFGGFDEKELDQYWERKKTK